MADVKLVTLIATAQLTPYKVGDVFGVTEDEAKLLLATKKVEKYDAKNQAHVAALEAQRGKPVDAE